MKWPEQLDKKFLFTPFSRITIYFTFLILFVTCFVLHVLRFVRENFGEMVCITLLGIAMAGISLVFLLFVVKRRFHKVKTPLLIFAISAGLLAAWFIKVPEERVHIIEFGILGWLVTRDMMKTKGKIFAIIVALAYCAFVGTLDELLQLILPGRYFNYHDIAFNATGGTWGIVLYFLT